MHDVYIYNEDDDDDDDVYTYNKDDDEVQHVLLQRLLHFTI